MKKVIVMLTALCVLALTGIVTTVSAGEVANTVQQECCKCCPDGCTCGDCDCCKAKCNCEDCNCCKDGKCGTCDCCKGKCDCGKCEKCAPKCDCGKCPACKDKKCKCKKSK